MRRRVVAGALVAVAAVAVAVAAYALWPSSDGAGLAREAAKLPPPEQPAFEVGRPHLLSRSETAARFAPVLHSVEALSDAEAGAAPVVRVDARTPEQTANIVLVVGERRRSTGLWVHVRLPVLPNGRTGWIPRAALGGYEFVHTHLVVDRARLDATLFDDGRPIFRAPVGVGKPSSPTPSGEFYVRDRVSGFGDPFYGPIAFGTSARSAVLTDWPDGGFVGIHGTNEPQLIPGAISHGCIRLRNADIRRLARLMPVGTPLTIR
jgi:lipoprotein-anchoring transpeptidase ErfK/SrfK